jgi:hypothetical protein
MLPFSVSSHASLCSRQAFRPSIAPKQKSEPTMKLLPPSIVSRLLTLLVAGAALVALPLAAKAHDHDAGKSGGEVTVTGEVLDMACYIDHGASGAKHADCAQKCIKNGLPVGLKASDGKTYLLIGEHMPANDELAKHAAQTITVRGKLVERDGINMLENIEIVKS